jgi:hypothetical protein
MEGSGGEEGHAQPKTIVKTKAIETWYKVDLM